MDRYKKKSLKFSGFGRELRTVEVNSNRALAREKRFSILRSLEVESKDEETGHSSKIPNVAISGQNQVGSRMEMLRKWKQEKIMKQQQEQRLKKPTFKVGIIKPTNPPVFVSKKFAFDKTASRLGISRMQASHVLPTLNKGTTVAASQTKLKPEVLSHHSSTSKMQFMPKPKVMIRASPLKMSNKESHLQASYNKTQSVATLNPKDTTKTGSLKVPNKESHLQASNNKTHSMAMLKPKDTTKTGLLRVPNKIPYSGLPKPTVPKIQNKKPMQMPQCAIPKTNLPDTKHTASRIQDKKCAISRLPDTKCRPKPLFGKDKIDNNTTTTSTIPSRSQGNITIRSNKNEESVDMNLITENGMSMKQNGNVPMKSSESETEVKQNSVKENSIPLEQDSENVSFQCNLSNILPAQEIRKSFAPKEFVFCPPLELNSSLYADGVWSIFSKAKDETIRTSTPKEKSAMSNARSSSSDVEDQEDIKQKLNDSDGTHPLEENVVTDKSAETQNVEQDKKPAPESISEGLGQKEATASFPELELDKFSHVRRSLRLANFPSDLDRRPRSFRQSERPLLASINEQNESGDATPQSGRKKTSLRKDFTPRRSLRLAMLSEIENLHEVRRPTLFSTPEEDEVFRNVSSSNLAYDFDRLHLEMESIDSEKDVLAIGNNRGKVSLLYTPPRKGKVSTSRKISSINGDLMSFSPVV